MQFTEYSQHIRQIFAQRQLFRKGITNTLMPNILFENRKTKEFKILDYAYLTGHFVFHENMIISSVLHIFYIL